MRKTLLLLFTGMICLAGKTFSQAPGYAFQAASGTYTPLVGGTPVVLTYNGAANNDDGITIPANAVPIGFTFNYNGTNYTSIKPCANGFASFSTTALTNSTDTWTNALATGPAANQRPLIAPLWDDNDMGAGAVTYQLSGIAPNRVLTIEWLNAKWEYNATTPAISFQAKLYETTNVIEFVYRQESGAPGQLGDFGASIGLTTTASGVNTFLALSDGSTNPQVSSTIDNGAVITKPATGQIYRWIPYCAASTTNTTGEKISNFTYNTINNNSAGTAGYENFSNTSTTVSLFPNSVLPFSVSVSAFVPADQVLIYIDFNHNGSFADAGETLYTSVLPMASGTLTGNLTIPALSASVLQGRTRLRIRLHDGSLAASCGTATNGQVEDYSVDIQPCFAGAISAQPSGTTICNGGNGSITVGSTGTNLTYKWQFSTNAGGTWTDVPNSPPYAGVTSGTLQINGATLSMNNYLYRVILNGTCTTPNLTSGNALLTVNVPASITSNPILTIVCEGSTAAFNVSATGSALQYQWQVSTDGGYVFTNQAGGTSATLSLPAVSPSLSLNRYRVITTVPACGSLTSTSAILKVNPLPTVTLSSALLSQLVPGNTTTLFATSNPAGASYVWTFNGSVLPGVTQSSYTANINGLGTYHVAVTDVNGCTNTTNDVTISGLPSDRMFIYPNPAPGGQFQVRWYSAILGDTRKFAIFNSAGQMILKKEIVTNNSYQEVQFDLGRMAAGVYTVEVRDRHNARTAVGQVIIR
jgi:hypothetical protein